jgi:Transposase, Mutator family
MGTRVTPSERLRYELDLLIDDAGELADPIGEIGRLGAPLIIQQALEDELTGFLGRARYERTGAPIAHRNGCERPQKLATTSGPMEIERPRVGTRRGSGSSRGSSARGSRAPTRWRRW